MSTLEERRRMARDWQLYNQVLRSDFFQRLATWNGQVTTLMDYDLTLSGDGCGWALVAISRTPGSVDEPMAYCGLQPLKKMRTATLDEIALHNMEMALSHILRHLGGYEVQK